MKKCSIMGFLVHFLRNKWFRAENNQNSNNDYARKFWISIRNGQFWPIKWSEMTKNPTSFEENGRFSVENELKLIENEIEGHQGLRIH